MKIVNLIENTEGMSGCAAAHGLSFYIETRKHILLLDLGPSEETVQNAEKLGIDLTKAEMVILSHGHYDHSDGIPAFARLNPKASIYIQASADSGYYDEKIGEDGEKTYKYIGIERNIADLEQIIRVDGDYDIDEELHLFTVGKRDLKLPASNMSLRLVTKDGAYVQDEFVHEQSLVITEDGRSILLAGCAHNGILNILREYRRKYGCEPDVVIGGFHLLKNTDYTQEEREEIMGIAAELKTYRTRFYTCHCTSIPGYELLKAAMGDQLSYVHSGDEVKL